jgi:hypothetical protein
MIFSPLLWVLGYWYIQLYHKSGEISGDTVTAFADKTEYICVLQSAIIL